MRNEVGLRCGFYLSAAALANCFAGALAYGLTNIKHSKIEVWRFLFLTEGLPVILASVIAFLFIPDSPGTAKFLTPSEQAIAAARTYRATGETANLGLAWKEIPKSLADYKLWILSFMYFCCNASFASLPIYLPQILKGWGYKDLQAQGFTAPPYLAAFFAVLLSTYIADRTSQRGITIIFLSLLGATGYLVIALQHTHTTNTVTTPNSPPIGHSVDHSNGIRYFGVFLAASGIFPAIANILPWVLNNQRTSTTRGFGIALINVIGQCGSLLGTRLYPHPEQPQKGLWICGGLMLFNAFLALALRILLQMENKRLESQDTSDGSVGSEGDGPGFRYIL